MSCRPSESDQPRPSPRLPPSPNSKHRSDAYEKEGALVTSLEVIRQTCSTSATIEEETAEGPLLTVGCRALWPDCGAAR